MTLEACDDSRHRFWVGCAWRGRVWATLRLTMPQMFTRPFCGKICPPTAMGQGFTSWSMARTQPANCSTGCEQWPALRPASEAPKGKRNIVHVEELKWLGRGIAEARGGFSNGMDGVIKRFRLIWTGGRWVVEKTTTEAIS